MTETMAIPPAAPPGFSAEALFAGIHWHQRWEIFRDVWTPGRNPVDLLCNASRLPLDLTGKRVLDVGAWHGCCSFECERRGASEVIAYSLEDPNTTGFYRLKEILNSKVQYINGTAYALAPETLGTFDVILFFGVLYHLRYPLLAIDRLRAVSRGGVFVETHVIDNYSWLRRSPGFIRKLPLIASALRRTPIWRQYEKFELTANDQSNWFGPNIAAVMESFVSAGFEITLTQTWGDRAAFHATCAPIPERLLQHTYEAMGANRDTLRIG